MQRERLFREVLVRQGDTADVVYGARLGLSASYWSHIKAGRRPLTDDMIRRLRRVYPDLSDVCTAALLEERGDSVA